jgi:hypothetical protein
MKKINLIPVPPGLVIKRGGMTVAVTYHGPTNTKGSRWKVQQVSRRVLGEACPALWFSEDYNADTEDRAFAAWCSKFYEPKEGHWFVRTSTPKGYHYTLTWKS